MEKSPNKQEWTRLYELASKVKKEKPWEYMLEDQVFCFIDPISQEPCLVSVMGTLGEHISVAVYVGAISIQAVLSVFQQGETEKTPDVLLSTTQVQLSFEDRGDIEKRDYKIIKELGLKFRGKKEWPIFRSVWPSHAPFFVNREEAVLLTCALEQLLEVLPKFKLTADEAPFYSSGELLFRYQENSNWVTENRPIPEAPDLAFNIEIDLELLEAVQDLPRVTNIIEIDSFINLAGIYGSRSERGVIPHMLLAVEGESGMILGFEMLDPSDGMLKMWSDIPQAVLEIFFDNEIVPETVWVQSPLIHLLVKSIFDQLGIEMKMVFDLPKLEEARMSMMMSLGGGLPPGLMDAMQQMLDEFGGDFPDDLPTEFFDLFDED